MGMWGIKKVLGARTACAWPLLSLVLTLKEVRDLTAHAARLATHFLTCWPRKTVHAEVSDTSGRSNQYAN